MRDKKTFIQVGIFVTILSLLFFIIVFVIGQERSMFESTTTLYTWFKNVGGLKAGAQVRLSGVAVGSVTEISFADALDEPRLKIEMQVKTSVMPRIRQDSKATISSKGLLGDKVIEISVGSMGKEQLEEYQFIESTEPPDIATIMETGAEMLGHIKDVAKDLSGMTSGIGEETIDDIKSTIAHFEDVMSEVRNGDGIVHGLIYDTKANSDFRGSLSNIHVATVKLNKSIDHVEKILEEVRTGDGLIHSLVYQKEGGQIVKNLEEASAVVTEIVNAIKNDKGMLHTLIYDEDKGNFIRNLNQASDDIRHLTEYIRSGQGTVGALINDPTVYEDLKVILGNIKRNKALKALVRMSIEREEEEGDSRRIKSEDEEKH